MQFERSYLRKLLQILYFRNDNLGFDLLLKESNPFRLSFSKNFLILPCCLTWRQLENLKSIFQDTQWISALGQSIEEGTYTLSKGTTLHKYDSAAYEIMFASLLKKAASGELANMTRPDAFVVPVYSTDSDLNNVSANTMPIKLMSFSKEGNSTLWLCNVNEEMQKVCFDFLMSRLSGRNNSLNFHFLIFCPF